MRRAVTMAALMALAACSSGLRGGVYDGNGTRFHVDPPATPAWSSASFSGNDLAWTAAGGHVLAVNATCEDHGDPSLKVLTDHLLMGFQERQVQKQEEMQLDGRGALRTLVLARLDGVSRQMELTVLKKDGCVYDFTYTAPAGRFDERADDYRKLVSSFRTGVP